MNKNATLSVWNLRGRRRAHPFNQLLPGTTQWVETLPEELRPLGLLRAFPRIANVVSRCWNDSDAFPVYVDQLLDDRRGSRRGFPLVVHNELMNLRDYWEGRYASTPSALSHRE